MNYTLGEWADGVAANGRRACSRYVDASGRKVQDVPTVCDEAGRMNSPT